MNVNIIMNTKVNMMNNLKLTINRLTSLNWMLCWTCKKIMKTLDRRNPMYLQEVMTESIITFKKNVKPEAYEMLESMDNMIREFE